MAMTTRQRVVNTLRRQPVDRLPRIEWASWWNKTIERWVSEGLPEGMNGTQIKEHFGLDVDIQFWVAGPTPREESDQVTDEASYLAMKKKYTVADFEKIKPGLEAAARRQENGDVIWMTLDGFFWYPRKLFGIEPHLYAFYDSPELMHHINEDITAENLRIIEEITKIVTPDFMTFGEDMSYNLGPMLSEATFDEFLLPYYKQVIPSLKKHDIIPLIDTDGDLTLMIPWLIRAGIEGALPLERQAGVDVDKLQAEFPEFALIGHFDKMTMFRAGEDAAIEAAMRQEFERLLPGMKRGKFIPSCDHQTPPSVSLTNYHAYLKLMNEYTVKAAQK